MNHITQHHIANFSALGLYSGTPISQSTSGGIHIMSSYDNFIRDFPSRCRDLLQMFQDKAELENRDVTLLLAIAASGLIIPRARLIETDHPSGDVHNFKSAAREMEKEMKNSFLKSRFTKPVGQQWRYGDVEIAKGGYPEGINTLCESISVKKQTGSVIKIIRNALAHGNILTRGNPIKRMFFLSKPFKGAIRYDCIDVTFDDFKFFLEKWFEFLSSLNLPNEISEGVDFFSDDRAA
jgi:hypothetical protein